MREYLPQMAGNEFLRERLGEEITSGAFAHAYIVEGAPGIGKRTLARTVAMALACENRTSEAHTLPCGICKNCRKIASGNCPDIITVHREEDKATMGVDVIRGVREDAPTYPNDLDFKLYVFEEAHLMTEPAQNALLLTLEEPPAFVRFLLLADTSANFLETVRSRAPILRMQAIPDEQMTSFLLSPERPAIARTASKLMEESPEEFASLLRMASGRIGHALTLLEEKKRAPLIARREFALTLCRALATGKKEPTLLPLFYATERKREEAVARLTTANEALRDLLALTLTDNAPLLFFTDRDEAQDLAARFTTAKILSFIRATDDTLEQLFANANVHLALTNYHARLMA